MERSIRVADAPGKGRGVFASVAIPEGAVIEVCPMIPLTRACALAMPKSFEDYVFFWNERDEDAAFAAAGGYGCFYNHSSRPNAALEYDFSKLELTFRAIRDIAIDEEIRFDYGDIWFEEE